MPTLSERLANVWRWVQGSPAVLPQRVEIPAERIDNGSKLGETFKPDIHYFQVRVNELYLTKGRQWFTAIQPMVFVASEFIYDTQLQTVPFVVGPELVSKLGVETPQGMLIHDARVAGTHPYRGGSLTLTVVLFSVPRKDYARELLSLIEGVAGALDFATALGPYLSVANVVLGGIESLIGLGETQPIAGLRTTFDPDAGDILRPSYLALIAPGGQPLDTKQLWVQERRLVYGPGLQTAIEFRSADYVLFSITQTGERGDIATLPFYPLYRQMRAAAVKPDDDSWKVAKANLVALNQAMVQSPDLTSDQVDKLYAAYKLELLKQRERAVDLGALGGEEDSEAEKKIRSAAADLDLP